MKCVYGLVDFALLRCLRHDEEIRVDDLVVQPLFGQNGLQIGKPNGNAVQLSDDHVHSLFKGSSFCFCDRRRRHLGACAYGFGGCRLLLSPRDVLDEMC